MTVIIVGLWIKN